MARISLRAYTHEIEEMIEHNQFDQAIAHCRNILKNYPKHINTYRLLGKAFLESQRYGDAGDIFQRILSSFPEDFISHVGMSIIREDEGNLDDSLWHMERAFEIQPSNNAIQGELRRLHGKLEGTEPAKVRLTRGALAHMYIRGDLLSQAIAELRIALTEDPSRFDLQTVLAKAYHQSGQLAEAAKISNNVIEKLPYNFEANRILADIYKKSDRLQEADTYQQRLIELDPYFSHVTDKTPTPEQVNDSAVSVERLDWKPGFTSPELSTQPDWAKSIGVSMESPITPKEKMPDWFSTVEETPIITGQSISPIIDIKEEESEIPSTWQAPEPAADQISSKWEAPIEPAPTVDDSFLQATESIQEEPQVFSEEVSTPEESVGAEAEELEPADIPDWLRALKPQTGSLEGKLPEVTTTPSEPQIEKEYSWLDETPIEQEEKWSPPEGEAEIPFEIPDEEKTHIPDWLQESEKPVAPIAEIPEQFPGLAQSEPQAVDEYGADTFKEEKDEFSWLSEDNTGQISEKVTPEESTVWKNEPEEELIPSESPDGELPPAVEVELPEWLAQMKQDAEQNPELIKPTETIPAWVNNLEEPPISEEDTKPTRLLQQLAAQEPTSFAGEEFPEAAIFASPESIDFEETPLSTIFEDTDFELKDEVQEISDSTFTKAVEEEGQTEWLTEMEARQQYEQGIFQEEKPETLPDWVSGSLLETETSSVSKEEPEILEEVELPDWLTQVAPKTEEEIETVKETKPDWLSEFENEPSQVQEHEEPIVSDKTLYTIPEYPLEEKAPEEEEAISSQEFAESQILDEGEQPKKEEEPLPEWLLEYKEEAPTEAIAESTAEPQPVIETPAWFEQPDEMSKLEISFDEEPSSEKPIAIEKQLPVEEAPVESIPFAEMLTEEQKGEELPVIETPAEEAPVESIPFAEMLTEEQKGEELPVVETPVEEAPVESIPFAEMLTEEQKGEELPVIETPVEEAPVESVPFAELLTEEQKGEELPVIETPVEETPVESIPFAELLTEEQKGEELPVIETPVEEAPVESIPFAEMLTEEQKGEELPVIETPAEETPVESIPFAELLTEEQKGEELPVIETPAEEAPVESIPFAEMLTEEQKGEELPVIETPVEEATTEELSVDEIETDIKSKRVKKAPVTRLLVEEAPLEEKKALIDLNQASLVELERIPGIGFIKAQNVINYRNEHGAFSSVDELVNVSGFDKTLINSVKTRMEVPALVEEAVQILAQEEFSTPLLKARNDLQQGKIPEAVNQYQELININTDLEDIAYDLQVAIDQYPTDTDLWQTLGDTCVRLGKLQDALNAYTQAEKLVR